MVYLQSLVMAQIMPVVVVASMAVSLILKMPGTFAMGFFSTAVNGLKTVITAIGAGIGIWGGINILESYSSGNPNEKTQGIKHFIPNWVEQNTVKGQSATQIAKRNDNVIAFT